jgi:oxygen-dependent protoporphyrinogen oxidase
VKLPHFVVVGGGISGLAAAWYLSQGPKGARAQVTVLEASPQFGGKLALGSFGGISLDTGAESLLAARPEAVGLCRELGLETVPAATTQAAIYSRGRLRQIPGGLLTGCAHRSATSWRPAGSCRCRVCCASRWIICCRAPCCTATSRWVTTSARGWARRSPQRLVEPMLGGVYAGLSEELSLQTTVPALYRAASQRRSALEAATSVLADGRKSTGPRKGPMFVGSKVGWGRCRAIWCGPCRTRRSCGSTVRSSRSGGAPSRWDVVAGTVGGATRPTPRMLSSSPPRRTVTGALLREVNEPAAHELHRHRVRRRGGHHLGYPAHEARHLDGSGFLVPRSRGSP